MNARFSLAVLIVSTFASSETIADPLDLRVIQPDATIDLRTRSGVDLVGGQWRYSDARIVEGDHRAPGHDLWLRETGSGRTTSSPRPVSPGSMIPVGRLSTPPRSKAVAARVG
jgi:hypothetical protein